jgi:hypothetical protein
VKLLRSSRTLWQEIACNVSHTEAEADAAAVEASKQLARLLGPELSGMLGPELIDLTKSTTPGTDNARCMYAFTCACQ